MSQKHRTILADLFQSGVSAVKGDIAVDTFLRANDMPQPTKIIAAGKAAVSMFLGLPKAWQTSVPTLLITKTDHIGDTVLGVNVTAIEASHPVPNAASIKAGQMALDLVAQAQPDDRLLLLVSGGASALVEHLRQDVSFDELVRLNTAALGDGADIAEINRRRKEISAIKGGQLLSHFKGADVDVLAISDVRGDSIDVIGSGLGAAPQSPGFAYSCNIVASNFVAREKVTNEAKARGLSVVGNTETLYADVAKVASDIAEAVQDTGLYIFGGEPTVVLPENPGQGGRNQALALELARHFQDRTDICGLVAGTDGTDGPTVAAGGYFDGKTFAAAPGAADALLQADSGSHLARVGDQFITGPTGTNVMDLVLVLKS